MIAQMQRDLLRVKEQSELMPASWVLPPQEKKLLKLMVSAENHDAIDDDVKELTSASCVLSMNGELLCIEHTTTGITREGLRSFGFFMPGRSMHRLLGNDEVRRQVGIGGKGGAKLFGCCVLVHSPFPGTNPAHCQHDDVQSGHEMQDVHFYSWLEEELEALVELLNAYCLGKEESEWLGQRQVDDSLES